MQSGAGVLRQTSQPTPSIPQSMNVAPENGALEASENDVLGNQGGRSPQWKTLLLLGLMVLSAGCGAAVSGQPASGPPGGETSESLPVVDIAIAGDGSGDASLSYTGTTEPTQQVSLRSQASGQLLALEVDIGDAVGAGQVLAQLETNLLQTEVGEAEAELAARQFEVAQAETLVADALARVDQVDAQLQQAQIDAERFQTLADSGAVTLQSAEQALTNLRTTEQELRSAQEQVRTRQQAVSSAQQRVAAQAALVQQSRERFSYATLVAPSGGIVLERLAEPGDFIQPGQEVLRIGDFSSIQVTIQVSDRDRSKVQVGQPVEVVLDAFPDRPIAGRVSRISPLADPAGRLIPVEIAIPNINRQIGSGLIARVKLASITPQRVTVPESALAIAEGEESVIFVVSGDGETPVVESRSVQVGDRVNGQVEILDGLEPGEAYVLRSNRPLQSGEQVQRSLLSES